ncbi:glutathione S-transferase N-terminal domain-containing protein [Paraburkholderia kirstenboschensis]|uniref:Glutathione S-transferase N-terminal domain-containing protein n=1 Tax=Paraburkholderia kirstenboschensis TaxID=1245436 RepID=A0ABZ0EBQ8_9BURK|nr:glutathione S-transferase N-terminal domain-containing protein [Paraburkholderia kirstenboschensis]WOD14644.1 glutathione S-transferase N-terminal domain-containing protein [Paraburkholderia kirstenboschensis]
MEKAMKLIGPWLSGFTRRTAITMKLLDIPFEHLNLNAYTDKDEVRRYSPMGKVPALVFDNGETMIDSSGIIDVLHEMVGPEKALIPPSGPARFRALKLNAIGMNIYPKLSSLYDETLRPKEHQLQSVFEGLAEQAIIGLTLLEQETGDGWLVNDKFGQADIMTAICYQAASMFILPDLVTAKNFPRLAALTERAMKIDAFASTVPHF